MKRSRFIEDQIIGILTEHEAAVGPKLTFAAVGNDDLFGNSLPVT